MTGDQQDDVQQDDVQQMPSNRMTFNRMMLGAKKIFSTSATSRVRMRFRAGTLFSRSLRGWLVLSVCLPAAGCVSPWWNAFLSPHEVGNFGETRVNEIQTSISFRDKPLGIPGAVDPTPEDLIATVEE